MTATTATEVVPSGPTDPPEERISVPSRRSMSDKFFRAVTRAAALSVLGIMGLIGLFLVLRSLPAFRSAGTDFFTVSDWNPDGGRFGIVAVLGYTVIIAVIALVIAVPLSIAVALFITEYTPRALRRPLTLLVDLLAAIPSLIYGLWGLFFLQPQMIGLSRFLADHFGFIPFFAHDAGKLFKASSFIAGTVVALMIVPICTAVMREAFSQAPLGEREGALALGGTRWGMIRAVVLPFGRGAIIGGSMLGLGRALGETIAIMLIISPSYVLSGHILDLGSNSIARLIADTFGDARATGLSALFAAGLVLFALTLVGNFLASFVVARSRSGAATEI